MAPLFAPVVRNYLDQLKNTPNRVFFIFKKTTLIKLLGKSTKAHFLPCLLTKSNNHHIYLFFQAVQDH